MDKAYVELRPDKSLVDPNFEGYKLSLEPLGVHDVTLKKGVETVRCPDDYYSFLQVKLFSEHNSLFLDPFNPRSVYYFDEFWRLCRVDASEDDPIATKKLLTDVCSVYILHDSLETRKCCDRMACSISFPSNEYAVVCDGANRLQLLFTGDRAQKSTSFKLLREFIVCDKRTPLRLVDSTMHTTGKIFLIDVLLTRVLETSSLNAESGEKEAATADAQQGWDLDSEVDKVDTDLKSKPAAESEMAVDALDAKQETDAPIAAKNDSEMESKQSENQSEMETTDSQPAVAAKKPSHVALTEWLTFGTQQLEELTPESAEKSLDWRLVRRRRLVSNALPAFLALDAQAQSLFSVCSTPLRFAFDTLKPVNNVSQQQGENSAVEKASAICSWSQSYTEVTIRIPLSKVLASGVELGKITKEQVTCHVEMDRVDLRVCDQAVFDPATARFTGLVHPRNSLYCIMDGVLELVLSKVDTSSWWPRLFSHADANALVDLHCEAEGEVAEDMARLDSMTEEVLVGETQLGSKPRIGQEEACDDEEDVDGASNEDEDTMLTRIDGNSHAVTQESSLRTNKFLFAAPTTLRRTDAEKTLAASGNSLKNYAICVRNDVDGLVWRLNAGSPTVCWQHVATFNAFGYVLASKTNRRFVSCAPSCAYVAVADCRRHVFVYDRACSVATALRNRKAGRDVHTVAKQYVVTLPDSSADDVVIGMRCTDDLIFVLTKLRLFAIRLSAS